MPACPRTRSSKRIARTAEILQIEPLLERKPSQLSGGQRQRVAIGRALVRDVDVFLFDEPLSNLDAKLRSELRVEIKRLHQKLANTMIYVTHDQIEAMTLADRIAVMKGGLIQQLDAPQDDLQAAGQPLRRRLHRLARHELSRRRGRESATARRVSWPKGSTSRSPTTISTRRGESRRRGTRHPPGACRPQRRRRAGRSRPRSRSRSSSRWAPTRWSGRSSASRTSPSGSLPSACPASATRVAVGFDPMNALAVRRRVGRTALGSIN